jgi:hypothetical protein
MDATITVSKMNLLQEVGRHLFGESFDSLNDIESIVSKKLGSLYRDFLHQVSVDVLNIYNNDQTSWEDIWERIVVDGIYYDPGELYQDTLKFIVIGLREREVLDGATENFLVYYILKENKLIK